MYLNQYFVSAVSVIMLAADAKNKEPTFCSVKKCSWATSSVE